MTDFKWRDSEKKIANRVFEAARLRELEEVINNFKQEAAIVSDADQLWKLIEQMRQRRHEFEQKYDFRYSVLITVFARLVAEDRVGEADLLGLDSDKTEEILRSAHFFKQ